MLVDRWPPRLFDWIGHPLPEMKTAHRLVLLIVAEANHVWGGVIRFCNQSVMCQRINIRKFDRSIWMHKTLKTGAIPNLWWPHKPFLAIPIHSPINAPKATMMAGSFLHSSPALSVFLLKPLQQLVPLGEEPLDRFQAEVVAGLQVLYEPDSGRGPFWSKKIRHGTKNGSGSVAEKLRDVQFFRL